MPLSPDNTLNTNRIHTPMRRLAINNDRMISTNRRRTELTESMPRKTAPPLSFGTRSSDNEGETLRAVAVTPRGAEPTQGRRYKNKYNYSVYITRFQLSTETEEIFDYLQKTQMSSQLNVLNWSKKAQMFKISYTFHSSSPLIPLSCMNKVGVRPFENRTEEIAFLPQTPQLQADKRVPTQRQRQQRKQVESTITERLD